MSTDAFWNAVRGQATRPSRPGSTETTARFWDQVESGTGAELDFDSPVNAQPQYRPPQRAVGGGLDFDSPAAPEEEKGPSTYQRLTSSYSPGVEEFAEKHPVLGPPTRFFDAAGGAAMAFPGQVYQQFRHPLKSATGMGGQVADAYRFWTGKDKDIKPSVSGVASVLPEALGQGTGNVAAGEMTGSIAKAGMGALTRTLPRIVRGARTTPEAVGEAAQGRLIASATQRQNAIGDALTREKQNIAPLYENLHAADEAENPAGAIDLSHVTEQLPEGTLPKVKAGAKLSPKEMQDAGFASKQAARMIANGMSEADARGALRNLGYSPNAVGKAMESVVQPEEGGGYTLAKARVLRQQIGRAAMSATRAGRDGEARALWQKYGDVTDAMRDRAEQIGGAEDFAKADARWEAVKDAERDLDGLMSARSGKRALADEFQSKWNELTSNERDQLKFLSKSAGLDLDQLKAQGKTAQKVLAGTKNVPVGWQDRWVKGYIPARIIVGGLLGGGAYYLGRHKISPGVREVLSMVPMLAGYGGVGFIKPIVARGAALEAMEDLPRELPRAGYGRAVPQGLTPQDIAQGRQAEIPAEATKAPVATAPKALPQPRIGRERQLPAYRGPGRPIQLGLQALPGMVARSVRGLLAQHNVNELPTSGETLAPGARRALPPANPIDLAEARTPKHGIRTVGGLELDQKGNITGSVPKRDVISAPGPTLEERATEQLSMGKEERILRDQLAKVEARISAGKMSEKTSREMFAKRRELLGKIEKAKGAPEESAEHSYEPEVAQQAKEQLVQALRLWEELPAPERSYADFGPGESKLLPRYERDAWSGTKSPRPMVEQMFPWVKGMGNLSDLRNAVRQGKGAAFDRWLRAAAEYVEKNPDNSEREPGEDEEPPF